MKMLLSVLLSSVVSCGLTPAGACTVAVLVHNDRVLFCNTEDGVDPQGRIWFVNLPGGGGCVYFGFENGWAQGGMNTHGLAFDGVAGFARELWEHDGVQAVAPDHSAERMLESCRTVEDAIAFYARYWEPALAVAKFVVADKSGASAIIGAKDGKLQVVRSWHGAVLGFAESRVASVLAEAKGAELDIARRVLAAAQRRGKYLTSYSYVFDLTRGEIHVFQPQWAQFATYSLEVELRRGGRAANLPRGGAASEDGGSAR